MSTVVKRTESFPRPMTALMVVTPVSEVSDDGGAVEPGDVDGARAGAGEQDVAVVLKAGVHGDVGGGQGQGPAGEGSGDGPRGDLASLQPFKRAA